MGGGVGKLIVHTFSDCETTSQSVYKKTKPSFFANIALGIERNLTTLEITEEILKKLVTKSVFYVVVKMYARFTECPQIN